MGRIRSQMISVRDLLRKMRSHAVISVLSAVGLATLGCGFVVFSAIDGLDTATYATKVIEEGDQVSIVYADPEGAAQTENLLTLMQNTMEEVRKQARENHVAVERAEDAVVNADERAQKGFVNTSEQIEGITSHMSSLNSNLSAFDANINGGFADTGEKLNLLLQQMELSNQNMVILQTQLNEARQEIEVLKGMITITGDSQNDLGAVIEAMEQKRLEDYASLKQMIDTNAANITGVSNRVPFALGVDGEGEYGYIKAGADTVIPFRHPGPKTGEIVEAEHRHVKKSPCYKTENSPTETEQRTCGGSMSVYAYANCSKCNEGPAYCAANPVCAAGGGHSMNASIYRCNSCGAQTTSPSSTCTATVTVPVKVTKLVCSHTTCGVLYIENAVTRTGRRECPLSLVCESDDAGMSLVSCTWRAENNGIISGDTDAGTVTAAHNGLYICTVTYQDLKTKKQYETEVTYCVVNLIK